MILDYVGTDSHQRFLVTGEEKVEFFTQKLRLRLSALPPDPFSTTATRYFVDRFPIGIGPPSKSITFTYFDHGSCTIKPFARFLRAYRNLFSAVEEFELKYLAVAVTNFCAARREFDRLFASGDIAMEQQLLPFGIDHMLRFFHSQRLWDETTLSSPPNKSPF